jgi:hypothetical protein
MNLRDVYPVENIKGKFKNDVVIEYYGFKDINKIAELEPDCLFEIGANAWMHYVESGAKVNPKKLSRYFDEHEVLIYRRVEKIIKRKVIQDIILIHASVDDDNLDRKICGQLLLARTYPNNIHISDVEFSNPYQPVEPSVQNYTFHEFRGLGLFSELLSNIFTLSKNLKVSKITLSAASRDQVPYFEKHGFTMEDTDFAKQGYEMDSGIPMELKCT